MKGNVNDRKRLISSSFGCGTLVAYFTMRESLFLLELHVILIFIPLSFAIFYDGNILQNGLSLSRAKMDVISEFAASAKRFKIYCYTSTIIISR